MLTRGAVAMDVLFPDTSGARTLVSRLVSRSQTDQPEDLEHDDERRPDQGRIVELRGLEPLTSSMPWKRATNCAKAP